MSVECGARGNGIQIKRNSCGLRGTRIPHCSVYFLSGFIGLRCRPVERREMEAAKNTVKMKRKRRRKLVKRGRKRRVNRIDGERKRKEPYSMFEVPVRFTAGIEINRVSHWVVVMIVVQKECKTSINSPWKAKHLP